MAHNYPLSPIDTLKQQFLGKRLVDLPTPSLILDRARLEKNCTAMLDVCEKLGVGCRAHVKSHKTLELAKMQVGNGLGRSGVHVPAKFIVSTVAEAENLREFVNGVRRQGMGGNVCCIL
jgi:D-serine deaminase-like pyridoxal phosphate-dependent protein